MMKRKYSELIPLNEILKQRVIDKRQPVLSLLDLVNKWPDIVGELIAEKTFPLRIQRMTLTLKTVSPVWANELQLMAPRLLEEISEHCPQLRIKRLRFVS
jgi:predicted nucleic acid-binding Zn ribbon protein